MPVRAAAAALSVILLLIGLFSPVVRAGPPADAAKQWPAVNPRELAMKDCSQYPGAPAVILYHEETWNDTTNTADFYNRIKVFREAGEDYGRVEIPYYPAHMRVHDIRGRTIYPDGKILDFDGEIYDRQIIKSGRIKIHEKAFALPGVQPGSILEYSYRLSFYAGGSGYNLFPESVRGVSADPTAEWRVQQNIFMVHGKFVITPYPGRNLSWSRMGAFALPPPQKLPSGGYVFEVSNVAPIAKEDAMPPEGALRGAFDFYYVITDLRVSTATAYWLELAKVWGEHFDTLLRPRGAIRKEAAQIVAGKTSTEAKARAIYARMTQIRNLDTEPEKTAKEQRKEGLKESRSLADVLKRGYSRGNQINYLYASLARAAGLDVDIVRVSDRSSRFFQLTNLDPDQASAEVVRVKVGGKDVFIDPASKFCPYGVLPWYETYSGGYVASKKHPEIITIPEPPASEALRRRNANLILDAATGLSGQLKVTLTGEEAYLERTQEHNKDATQRREDAEAEVKGWIPRGSTVKLVNQPAWNETSDTLNLVFSIKVPAFGLRQGRYMILPTGVFETTRAYPFQSRVRYYPVDLHYPYERLDKITIKIPAGFKVEALPDERRAKRPYGSYGVSCRRDGNQIVVTRHTVMNKSLFDVKTYPDLRQFFAAMRIGDRQQALLTEVQHAAH